jgi:DNA-binding winged helix-turn-helix (wHTH) protein/tetratricopeptide (TPR) repeat protein
MVNQPELLESHFRLAEWEVHREDGALVGPSRSVRIQPQVMGVLVYLCSRAGTVVSKKDLLQGVWGGRAVSDDAVFACLRQLRRALGDDARRPRFVETIPKRGYRMLVRPKPLSRPGSGSSEGPRQGSCEEACRQGRAALGADPGPADLSRARRCFELACRTEPSRAEAFSGLATTYVLLVTSGLERPSVLMPLARSAALRALELEPANAQGHACLGALGLHYDYNFAAGERAARRAIALDPTAVRARRWLALLLSVQGQSEEAVAQARTAVAQDRFSLSARRDLLWSLFLAGRLTECETEAQDALALAPYASDIRLGLTYVHAQRGGGLEAAEALLAALEFMGAAPETRQAVRSAFDRGGIRAVLLGWLRHLEGTARVGERNQVDLLLLRALVGDADGCLVLLERALQEREPFLPVLLASPPVRSALGGDPRYDRLVQQVGQGNQVVSAR